MTASKKQDGDPTVGPHGRYWQPPEERTAVSDQGRTWLEENAEAIKDWNEWVATNGLPLARYRKL